MKYFKSILFILIIFPIVLISSPLDQSKTNKNEQSFNSPSRLFIGEGAKVIIDGKASAKLYYNDLVLSNNSKYVTDTKELDLNRINNNEEKIDLGSATALPTELEISKAFPNPFNPVVGISYGLPTSSDVRIFIHDLSGRKIAEYNQNGKTAGWHEFRWDATDGQGNGIGSGVYLLTIQASDMVKKQKLTFIK